MLEDLGIEPIPSEDEFSFIEFLYKTNEADSQCQKLREANHQILKTLVEITKMLNKGSKTKRFDK